MSDNKTLVLATSNRGKAREISEMLAPYGITVKTRADYPELAEVVEDGDTFVANAKKKAVETAHAIGLSVLADDSGLCVDALDGAPGVISARYAGEPSDDAANNRKLLAELRAQHGIDETAENHNLSTARFVCALVLAVPDADGQVVCHTVEGTCEGQITNLPAGEHGFGYDPLFYVPQLGKTLASCTPEEKNAISHRGAALREMLPLLSQHV